MLTTIEIGGVAFSFSAAHAGLHDGEFEPLHGHTYTPNLRLMGDLNSIGMVIDFHPIKKALADIIAPLKRRILLPADAPTVTWSHEDDQLFISCGAKRYGLPAADVAILPVVNTTTEAIAAHLAGQLLPYVRNEPGVRRLELTLAEAADTTATVRVDMTHDSIHCADIDSVEA